MYDMQRVNESFVVNKFVNVDLHMTSFMEAVCHRPPEGVVPIKDSPSCLKNRIEEAIAGRTIPESVEPRPESDSDFLAPVDYVRLLLQLALRVAVQQLGVKLLLSARR